MGRLDGKVAIVTGRRTRLENRSALLTGSGAGSGFGAAISKAFASEGAKVLVCDINQTGGDATVQANPSAMTFHKMDVTKSDEWKATVDAAITKFGSCDILVNNAGTSYRNKPTIDVTEEEFQKTFDVNVKGVFLGCNAWSQQAIDRKEGGVIINISSVGATRPRPGLVSNSRVQSAMWSQGIKHCLTRHHVAER
jgi:NAD(P)-dependent dehydrogenase (short-subunit alcohol dehydrogenase family)